jgi:hypothetical protein
MERCRLLIVYLRVNCLNVGVVLLPLLCHVLSPKLKTVSLPPASDAINELLLIILAQFVNGWEMIHSKAT